jgi:hypothetical protein
MEITLKIEAHQLGETVEEVFKTLTDDQKRELAKEAVRKWLEEPLSGERAAYEEKAIADLRKACIRIGYYSSDRNSNDPKVTDDEIRGTPEFRSRMSEYRSTRERLVTSVCEQAVSHAKEYAIKAVSEDAKLRLVFDEVRKKIEEMFPQMVYGAMVRWFSENMREVVSMAQYGTVNELQNVSNELARLKADLSAKYNMQLV